jgi:hypothetical protein
VFGSDAVGIAAGGVGRASRAPPWPPRLELAARAAGERETVVAPRRPG